MEEKKPLRSKQSMFTFFPLLFCLFFPIPPMAMVSDTDVFGNEMAPSKCKANTGPCFFTCASSYEEFILCPRFWWFPTFFVHEKLLLKISCVSSPVRWYIVSRFVGARSFSRLAPIRFALIVSSLVSMHKISTVEHLISLIGCWWCASASVR